MDTRFFGPSGWQLMHSIASTFSRKHANYYRHFFEAIPYILPCRFCRESSQQFVKELPTIPVDTREAIEEWVYKLHDKVNDKLLRQEKAGEITGVVVEPSPSLEQVRQLYRSVAKKEIKGFLGMDFLAAIQYNYRNNTESNRDAMYSQFWTALKHIYPIVEARKHFLDFSKNGRQLAWFHEILSSVYPEAPSYRSLALICAHYQSKCMSKIYRGKTCRLVVHGTQKARVKQRDPKKIKKFVHARLVDL